MSAVRNLVVRIFADEADLAGTFGLYRDPVIQGLTVNPMRPSKALLAHLPSADLLWARVRESLNIIQAEDCGCYIVIVPHDMLNKPMTLFGTDLEKLSLDRVKMLAKHAELAGFTL
jgi:hypothetical protein